MKSSTFSYRPSPPPFPPLMRTECREKAYIIMVESEACAVCLLLHLLEPSEWCTGHILFLGVLSCWPLRQQLVLPGFWHQIGIFSWRLWVLSQPLDTRLLLAVVFHPDFRLLSFYLPGIPRIPFCFLSAHFDVRVHPFPFLQFQSCPMLKIACQRPGFSQEFVVFWGYSCGIWGLSSSVFGFLQTYLDISIPTCIPTQGFDPKRARKPESKPLHYFFILSSYLQLPQWLTVHFFFLSFGSYILSSFLFYSSGFGL